MDHTYSPLKDQSFNSHVPLGGNFMTTLQSRQETSNQPRRFSDANRSETPECDIGDHLFAEFLSVTSVARKQAFFDERQLNRSSHSSMEIKHFPPRAETELYSHLLRRHQHENLSDKTVRYKPTADSKIEN